MKSKLILLIAGCSLCFAHAGSNCANGVILVGTGSISITHCYIIDNKSIKILESHALGDFEITNSGDQEEDIYVTATCEGAKFTKHTKIGTGNNNSPARFSGQLKPWCSEIYSGREQKVTATMTGSGKLNAQDTYTVMY